MTLKTKNEERSKTKNYIAPNSLLQPMCFFFLKKKLFEYGKKIFKP